MCIDREEKEREKKTKKKLKRLGISREKERKDFGEMNDGEPDDSVINMAFI